MIVTAELICETCKELTDTQRLKVYEFARKKQQANKAHREQSEQSAKTQNHRIKPG